MAGRIIEIDIIKGIAVSLMVFFHFFMMAELMGKKVVASNHPLILPTAVLAHTTFIIMVGVNLHISYQKNQKDKLQFYKKQVKRSWILFFFALLMSASTYYLFPDKWVRYGIFHFISTAIIASFPFVSSAFRVDLGILVFVILLIFTDAYKDSFYGICSNIKNICFNMGLFNFYGSLDHFSFIPYFIYVLLGIRLGMAIYPNAVSPFRVPQTMVTKSIAYLGKNSLSIYLVHWFILWAILSNL